MNILHDARWAATTAMRDLLGATMLYCYQYFRGGECAFRHALFPSSVTFPKNFPAAAELFRMLAANAISRSQLYCSPRDDA